MKPRVQVAEREHLPWLASRVGYHPTASLFGFEALDSNGRILAMSGLDNWMPNSVEVHFAADDALALRHLFRPTLRFAFVEQGRDYIVALTPASRGGVLAWGRRLGFKELHRLADGYAAGDDLIFSALHKKELRHGLR